MLKSTLCRFSLNMRHHFLNSLFLLLLLGVFSITGQAAPSPSSIRVVLDDNYPPYIFRDSKGQIQGILKDLWALWEQRTGVAVSLQPMDWSKAQATMENGQADVIDTIFETETRRKIYDFSRPYATIEVPIFFHKSISGITDANSLKGFTIGVKDGDACVEFLSAHGVSDFRRYPSYESEVKAAIRQEIRILCIDKPPAFFFFNREGAADEFRYSPPLYVGEFHWAVAKGNSDLKRLVEDGFSRITEAERAAIKTRWLGESLSSGIWPGVARYGWYALLFVLLVIVTLVAWNRTLRRRVAVRTRELSSTVLSLRETENRFRTLFEQANDAILIMQGPTVLDCNHRAEALFGSPRDLIVGATPLSFSPVLQPDGQRSEDLIHELLAKAQTGQAVVFEWRHVRSDGTPFDVEVNLGSVNFGGKDCLQAIIREITERKRAEEELRRSEAIDAKMVANISDVIIIVDKDGFNKYRSPNIERLFGWAPEELDGASAWENVHADDLASAQKLFGEIIRTPSATGETEFRYRCKGGNYRWVHITAMNLLHDPDIRGVLGSYHDITERKQAEAAREEALSVLLKVASRVPGMIYQYRLLPDGRSCLPFASEAIREIYRLSPEVVREDATKAFLHHHPDDQAGIMASIQQSAQDLTPWRHEYRVKFDDGTVHYLFANALPQREDDGSTLWHGFITDITERKQAEAAISESRNLLLKIIDTAPIRVFWKDSDLRYRGCNTLFAKDAGMSHPKEVIGKDDYDMGWVAQAKLYRADDLAVIASGLPKLFYDEQQTTPDGKKIWLRTSKVPLRNKDNETIGLLGIYEDITERKQMEVDLETQLTSLTTLNMEYKKINDKLTLAQNQLLQSEKLAAIGLLSAGVAHEINNPISYVNSNLGTLKGYVDILLNVIDAYERAEGNVPDAAAAFAPVDVLKAELDLSYLRSDVVTLMTESRDGLERVKKIIQSLKDFARVGTAEAFREDDIQQGIESTLTVAWNELKYKCEVRREYGDLPPVECLLSNLNQVFMNLLVNAAHAIERQGVITIRTGRQGEEVWVEISDTGKGIPAENLSRIFDPFFTTKPVGEGTGLGLSVSYGIVQKHHGRIEAISEVGMGTTFRIWLPVKQPAGVSAQGTP